MSIVVESISKSFGQGDGRVEVLRDLSCRVEDREICVVVGASGSGKSTLLNCIGGLDRPDDGSITVNGQSITGLRPKALPRFRCESVGFVFQFYNLVPNLTVLENIEVCEHLADNPMPIGELVDTLGLSEHKNKFPSQLSGGQQQRCAIARALAKRPEVLLCDEPTGALDYSTSKEMLALLQRVNEDLGTTIVIVTHNEAISRMAHRRIVVRDGQVRESSATQAPVRAEALSW